MCFGRARVTHVAVVLAVLTAPAVGRADSPPPERPGQAPAAFGNVVVHLDRGGAVRVDGVPMKREAFRDHLTRYLRVTAGKAAVTVHCRADVPFREVFQLLQEIRETGAWRPARLSVRE
jgi:biopolymer transport protein ExbD